MTTNPKYDLPPYAPTAKLEELTPEQRETFDYLWEELPCGSDYWLRGVEYQDDEGNTSTYSESTKMRLVDGSAEEIERRSGIPQPREYTITRQGLLEALRRYEPWFIQHHNRHFRHFGKESFFNDFGYYDASITDCLLQLALFGATRYA